MTASSPYANLHRGYAPRPPISLRSHLAMLLMTVNVLVMTLCHDFCGPCTLDVHGPLARDDHGGFTSKIDPVVVVSLNT